MLATNNLSFLVLPNIALQPVLLDRLFCAVDKIVKALLTLNHVKIAAVRAVVPARQYSINYFCFLSIRFFLVLIARTQHRYLPTTHILLALEITL
ncbi:MAG TPA: hypothetical protein PKC68_07495 [Alphaproteobacteria bacterium]|nr:hypothetical protein [Alphaproteobacteria bacterium]